MQPLLIPLPGNEDFAAALADRMGSPLGTAEFRRLPDGETYVRAQEKPSVRDRHVILVCSFFPANEKVIPVMFLAGALRDLGAKRIGLVCPYLAYLRQDRRKHPGEALSAAYVARWLSGWVDWLVTIEPHVREASGLSALYSIPARSLSAAVPISSWIRSHIKKPVLIGPDEGSRAQLDALARAGGFPYKILEKMRLGDRAVEVQAGDLTGISDHTPVIVDDIISTGGTMIDTVRRLKEAGLSPPTCIGVHGIFAEGAYDRLKDAGASQIVTCNTIPHPSNEIDVVTEIADALSDGLD